MNTPGGNAVSVAEHTLALMLSLARSIPNASASVKSGKWEKRKFMGNELRAKTVGVIGLGSIGREVVKRAAAFEMRIIAHDPYVHSQTAKDVGVALVDLPTLFAESDYITLHTALTPESFRLLSRDAFAKMKKGVRIINCARGELIDQEALREALASGQVGGAALDVFESEPPSPNDPLFAIETLVATPHIGGSTEEAQETVGIRIAQQIVEYLQNGAALHAVNLPALTPEQYKTLGPYGKLAERLGRFASYISTGNPKAVRLVYFGKIAEFNTHLVRNAGLAGVLQRSLARKCKFDQRHANRGRPRAHRSGAPRKARGAHRFGSPGSGDRHRHHFGGRRGGDGRAAADPDRWHALRSHAGRQSHVRHERGCAGRDRIHRRRLRQERRQHRDVFAGPQGGRDRGDFGDSDRSSRLARTCWRNC